MTIPVLLLLRVQRYPEDVAQYPVGPLLRGELCCLPWSSIWRGGARCGAVYPDAAAIRVLRLRLHTQLREWVRLRRCGWCFVRLVVLGRRW